MLDYRLQDDVAVLELDDGKANVLSHAMVDSVNEALDRAAAQAKAVLLVGRRGMFSGGFDLSEFRKGPDATQALVDKGGKLITRVFTHPQPVVAACTGHAIAAGAFLLLASDTRLGAEGEFKIGLNETSIGAPLPVFGFELAQARLSRRHLTPAVTQARMYDPASAVDAGFLDRTAPADGVVEQALAEAARLGALPSAAYTANKLGIRQPVADAIAKGWR